MRPRRPLSLYPVLCLAVLILFVPCSWSQSTTGSIYGQVTDPSKAVVPGAAVTARSQADNAAPVCSLLKRMFSRAAAEAGITLLTGLPTSMLVNCREEGWNQSLTASSGRTTRWPT